MRKSLGLLLGSFLCWNRRVLLQLLNCVVNPFVLRFWHRAKSLIAIKCLLDILAYVIFYIFIKPMSRRLGVLPVFVRWLTSFNCTRRPVLITLLGSKTTAIGEMPAFTSFLYDKTFSIFSLTLIIVKNHLLKLIKLKCLHKPLLLLLEIKLFLGIWVMKTGVPFVSWVTVFIQSVSWFIFVARVVISIYCAHDILLVISYLVPARRRRLN